MPTILLDIDGVLADFVGAVRRTCAEVGHNLTSPTAHNFTDNLPAPVYAHYVGASTQFGWCSAIEPYEGAYAFVADLHTLGDVVAVTLLEPEVDGLIERQKAVLEFGTLWCLHRRRPPLMLS